MPLTAPIRNCAPGYAGMVAGRLAEGVSVLAQASELPSTAPGVPESKGVAVGPLGGELGVPVAGVGPPDPVVAVGLVSRAPAPLPQDARPSLPSSAGSNPLQPPPPR